MNKMSADDENHQNRLNFVPGISKAAPAEPEDILQISAPSEDILQISAPSEVKVTPGEDSLGEEEDRESLVTTPELEEDINDIEPVAVPPLLPLITSGISDFEKIWGEENKENIMAERNEQQDEPPPGLLLMKADSINANTVFVNPATFQRVNPPVPQQLATTGATAISNPLQLMTTAASGSSNMQQLVSSGSSNMQQLVSAASQLISSPSSSLPVLIPAPSHSRPLTAIKQQQPLNAVNQYPSIVGIGYGVPIQQQQTGFQQQQTGLEEQQLTGYQHQQEEEEDYTKYCQDITPPIMLQSQTQRGVKRQSVDSEPSYDLQYSTKEETENSNSSYGGGESYTVGVQDALEGYSGGGGGQEGYNNYVMPGTSTGVQQDFNEQLDAKLAGQIANIMQTKINSKTFSGFEPSPSGEDISVKDYPGVHNFEVKFSKQSTKSKHWDYSKKLNKLFIDMNKWVQVEFKIGSDPPPDLTIRTLPVYTDPSSRREPVKRCPIHANTEEKTNNDFSYPHHIIRYQNDKTMYDEDMKSGRLFSLFKVSTPHKGTDTISRMIKFMCLGSDPGGINRRPIKVVFTLECEGRVLGRRCLDVRVCSCPKRDLQQEENKATQQEIQVKRISEKVKPALSVSERLQSVLDPPSSKRRRMDDGNSTNNGVIIMVPVHSDDFRKINELVESAWICREPDKQQQIKDTRFRLLQEMTNSQEEGVESTNDKTYQKIVTLQKKYGKTGSVKLENGGIYIGDFDENGVKTGLGHMEISNGSTYDGTFSKGLPNGVGVMRFPDSSRYEGEFMQGWFHGHGVYATIDGMKYEGEFRGGKIWGNGLMTYSDGAPSSEGYFQETKFREEPCKENIKRARKIAMVARRCCDEMEGTCEVGIRVEKMS